jgi:hypothetical protein
MDRKGELEMDQQWVLGMASERVQVLAVELALGKVRLWA